MHKHTKLPPVMRKEVYQRWIGGQSQNSLADEYHVDKKIIHRIVVRGRLGDFSVHDSTNERYRTIEYGLKRLLKTEKKLQKRAERLAIKRYEKEYPGEMVHADTKLLPRLLGETKGIPRERLYVAIDDHSRTLVADILPSKSQESSAMFGEIVNERIPFDIRVAQEEPLCLKNRAPLLPLCVRRLLQPRAGAWYPEYDSHGEAGAVCKAAGEWGQRGLNLHLVPYKKWIVPNYRMAQANLYALVPRLRLARDPTNTHANRPLSRASTLKFQTEPSEYLPPFERLFSFDITSQKAYSTHEEATFSSWL